MSSKDGKMNPFTELWQSFIYGTLHRRPAIDLSEIPNTIKFVSAYDAKNDLHVVVAEGLPEFFATGKTSEELAKNVGDTLMVYFDVPTYFAKKFEDGVFSFENKKTGQSETIQVKKEALNRVFA